MSGTEIYNKLLAQFNRAMVAAMADIQHDLEQLRHAHDMAISRADVNQRKYESADEDLQQLRAAFDRQVSRGDGLIAELSAARKQVVLLEAELRSIRLCWHPHYTSTYCVHGLHDQCRRTCKTCGAYCKCRAQDCLCDSLASQVMDLVEELDAIPVPPDAEPIP